MAISLHRGDLPADLSFGPVVAIDTETMGLNPHRDRLCLVQLSAGDGNAHLVQIAARACARRRAWRRLLADPKVAEALPFRPLRHRRAASMPRRALRAGLLHQDRLQAGRAPSPTGTA